MAQKHNLPFWISLLLLAQLLPQNASKPTAGQALKLLLALIFGALLGYEVAARRAAPLTMTLLLVSASGWVCAFLAGQTVPRRAAAGKPQKIMKTEWGVTGRENEPTPRPGQTKVMRFKAMQPDTSKAPACL